MVNMIKRNVPLAPYLVSELEDEGITVEIDPRLSQEDYAAIKVDDYYAGQGLAHQPKSVDFVVVVDCQCNSFSMYILEFKNVNGPNRLNIKEIQEKFHNTIYTFLSDTFSDIFLNDRFKYKQVKLYLVSDAYGEVGHFQNHQEYSKFRNRINAKDSLKVDVSLTTKVYKFRGKMYQIEYDIPPNPIITRV